MNPKVRGILAIGIALLVVVVVLVAFQFIHIIPLGHVGVVTNLGQLENQQLDEGFHLVAFWKKVTLLTVRIQEEKFSIPVPTSEGLTADIDVSVLFRLIPNNAGSVMQNYGKDYSRIVIEPHIRSAVRGETAKVSSEALYTKSRDDLQVQIEQRIKTALAPSFSCEQVLLRNVKVPPAIQQAVEAKVAAEQMRQRSMLSLEQAKIEAEQKLVEAQATAKAQDLINKTLTPEYVRYLYVKALETAANKPSTVIYVPTDMSLVKEMK